MTAPWFDDCFRARYPTLVQSMHGLLGDRAAAGRPSGELCHPALADSAGVMPLYGSGGRQLRITILDTFTRLPGTQ